MNDTIVWKENKLMEDSADNMRGNTPSDQSHAHGIFYESLYFLCTGDWIPVRARFSAPVHTGPEAHPASCTMGTGAFPGVRCGRGVTLTPHPF